MAWKGEIMSGKEGRREGGRMEWGSKTNASKSTSPLRTNVLPISPEGSLVGHMTLIPFQELLAENSRWHQVSEESHFPPQTRSPSWCLI